MRAVWKLLSLPLRQMPLAAVLMLVCLASTFALLAVTGSQGVLLVVGFMVWFWHIIAGTSLRSALRAETRLLPYFHRRLLLAGLIDIAATVALPVVLALLFAHETSRYAPLLISGLLLVAAVGLATGAGMRAMLLVWLVFIVVGWWPGLAQMIGLTALHSLLTPVALVLMAVLVTSLALRPLLTLGDREITESPLGVALSGNRPDLGSGGQSRPRTRITRLLSGLFEGNAEQALRRALQRFEHADNTRNRIAVVRAVLLPHDNPRTVLMQIVVIGFFASLYFFATHAAQRWNATYVGAYAVILGMSRFNTVGRGLVRMRANMAELYMTLAPQTHRQFQATLADTLLWLVGVAVFNCLAYAVLIIILLHAHAPWQLLLAAGISGLATALGALSSYLIGPDSRGGQMLVRLVMVSAGAGAYLLVHWLLGRFGLTVGSLISLVLTLPFGIGAWQAARREYLRRVPRFDVPV